MVREPTKKGCITILDEAASAFLDDTTKKLSRHLHYGRDESTACAKCLSITKFINASLEQVRMFVIAELDR